MTQLLRLGTRGSPLALWQANHVADLLRRAVPDLSIELVKIETAGDGLVTQYRGRLMPLVAMSGTCDPERPSHPVLVFADVVDIKGDQRTIKKRSACNA